MELGTNYRAFTESFKDKYAVAIDGEIGLKVNFKGKYWIMVKIKSGYSKLHL